MKRSLCILALVVLAAGLLVSLGACSSEDKPTLMYFRSGT